MSGVLERVRKRREGLGRVRRSRDQEGSKKGQGKCHKVPLLDGVLGFYRYRYIDRKGEERYSKEEEGKGEMERWRERRD